MKLSVDELREMIRNEINHQVLQEGPYLDRVKARADAFRRRGDDIVRAAKAVTQTSDSSTPSTPSTPAPTTQPTPSTLPTPSVVSTDDPDPVDPEDMLQPDDPPAPSNDASFETLLDVFDIDDIAEAIAALLPLAGIRDVRDAKFIKIVTELGEYILKANNIDLQDTLPEEMDLWAQNFGWTSEILRDRWEGYYDFDAARDLTLDRLQDSIGKIDPKTGFSGGLQSLIWWLGGAGGARTQGYTENVKLKKAYPALLRLTNSLGGSSASEKLKDILTTLDVMAPEDVGREREGALSSFWNDAIKGRRYKEREALRAAVD